MSYDNYPIPLSRGHFKQVLFDTKVGESFTTEIRYRSHIYYAARLLGYEITMRCQYGQLRVWLVNKEKKV